MKKIFKDHDIYEIKKQINELNEQHEDEYDKNKKKRSNNR